MTQDLCAVCAVSSGELASACPVGAELLSLDPRTLGEVADTVRVLARALDRVDRGETIVNEMWATIEAAADAVRGLPRPRVFFAEWIEPPFSAGHWLPEMIELAGGVDVLGAAGQPSRPTTWEAVAAAQPELIIIAPCGFDADEASERAAGLELPCPAVAVDADSYYSRPAPRLADGVAQLAHLLHPESARRIPACRQSRCPAARCRPGAPFHSSSGGDDEGDLVDVAPAPVLARLGRTRNWMVVRRSVTARMPIRRRVAATDLPAAHAHPKMHPRAADLQALLAADDRRWKGCDLDRVEVAADSHCLSSSRRVRSRRPTQ